jgi:nanoRNase/pAp phosphatase (c-di-AMP/oligoRNAs hydrolase)
MELPICFYHSVDLDGECSAAIVKYHIQDILLYPFNYDDEFPWYLINKNTNVYMVDISLSIEDMNKVNDLANEFIYIDHHISKLKDLDLSKFKGIQRNNTAACVLTWEYFNNFNGNNNIPECISLLGKFDIWDLSEDVLNFQFGMKTYNTDPNNIDFWRYIFNHPDFINKIIDEGKIVQRYLKNHNKKLINSSGFIFKFRNYSVLAINSITGGKLLFQDNPNYKEVDILMTFGWVKNIWKVSMYTTKDINVSIYCKEFGGGGHISASGFHCKELPNEIFEGIFNASK